MYNLKKYPNGLRLITASQEGTKALTIFVMFKVGSRYERRNINGASHFLEHLFFKGTKKRPNTLAISKELDRVGAEFNAMTSKEYTGYYVKVSAEKAKLAADVLSDMLFNSKFEAKEINRERGVIIEEINMYQDNPLMYIEDVLEQVVFEGNTLGWEIAGPKKVIEEVSRQELLKYKDEFYQPNNMVVVAAGKVDEKVEKILEEFFVKPLNRKISKNLRKYKKFTGIQKAPRVKVLFKETEQVQLAFGFKTYGLGDKRLPALQLLSIILGGNMSSRLFISVRERNGLAYFVRCYINNYQDTGSLVVQSGLDKSRLEKAIKIILKELKKVVEKGVKESELKNAKDFLRGKTVLNLEDSSRLATWYARQETLSNKVLTPEEKLALFDKVTATDIHKVAKEVFQTNRINLALIGPFKDGEKFKKLLEI